MVGDTTPRAVSQGLQVELDGLCRQIAGFNGYRSVWLSDAGQVWHAEPDEMLEELGYRYVGTFMRPTVDELGLAVASALPWGAAARGSAPQPQRAAAFGTATAMPALA